MIRVGRLPFRRIHTFVVVSRVKGGANFRAMDDFMGVVGKYFVGHGVPNGVSKADKATSGFARGRRETWIMGSVVDRLVEVEAEDDTDVRGDAVKHFKRGAPVERGSGGVIENKSNVDKGKEPGMAGCTSAIDNSVSNAFDILVTTFSFVLMLMVGFRLPVFNDIGTEDFFDSCAGGKGGGVADQLDRSTSEPDVIFECLRELLGGVNAIDVDDI